MFTELNHVGINVRDLDASLAFYQGNFDARVAFRGHIQATSTDIVYLQIGQGLIELLNPRRPSPDDVFGVSHIAFMTDALDADFTSLMSSGYRELTAPKVAGTGIGRLAFVESPGGARVELIQRELELREDPDSGSSPLSIEFFGLAVHSVESELGFFRDALGMAEDTRANRGAEDGPAAVLHFGADSLGIFAVGSPTIPSASWHVAIQRGGSGDAASTELLLDPDGVEVVVTGY